MSGTQSVLEGQHLVDQNVARLEMAKAMDSVYGTIATFGPAASHRDWIAHYCSPNPNEQVVEARAVMAKAMEPVNAIAAAFRRNPRKYMTGSAGNGGRAEPLPTPAELAKSGEISKAVLDVGTSTNYANMTGGQALGYLSLDTSIARGTVRPASFTLYQSLKKTPANQIVDYWAYIDDTGGAIPGAAFGSYNSVSSGVLQTNVGKYQLMNVNLKLMLDARAMTIALAAQNSFADIPTQESANAALTILQTANWTSYFGNAAIFPNQFNGLASLIPTANVYDFQAFYNTKGVANNWSTSQALYNLIYEAAGDVTKYGQFSQITHAFMSPAANGSMASLVTTVLNNILNVTNESQTIPGIIINGDLQGMKTRFGEIQFVLDLFINARNTPIQAITLQDGTNKATTSGPTPPSGVTAALVAASGIVGNGFSASYAPTGATNSYVYAVAGLGPNTEESVLTYTSVVTGVAPGGGVTLTINPAAANDITAVRIYRSGMGYNKTGGAIVPLAFRYIATVAATGTTPITFTDQNQRVPGGEDIFLLDLAEEDNALDWRYLLPLSRIELFAQNLYQPWAVAMIGALRIKVPKFHARIVNFVPDTPAFSPLAANY